MSWEVGYNHVKQSNVVTKLVECRIRSQFTWTHPYHFVFLHGIKSTIIIDIRIFTKYDSLAPLFFQLVVTRSCNLKIKLPWNSLYQPQISLQTNNRDVLLHSTCKVASSRDSGIKTMLGTSQFIPSNNHSCNSLDIYRHEPFLI